jgi:hypothetical protein
MMTDKERVLKMISAWRELWNDTEASDGNVVDEFNQLVSNIEKDIANDDEDDDDEEIPLEDRALGCNDYRDDAVEPFGHY